MYEYTHDWSYHQHEVSGWHGNMQTEIQHFRCRKCGTIKQMPAFLDCKPPNVGCLQEKIVTERVKEAIDPLEEKGDYDEQRPIGRTGKNHR